MSGKAHPPRGVRRRKRSTEKGQNKAFNVKRGAAGGAEDGRRVRLLCRASRANLPQSFRAQSSPFMLCVCRRLCASSVSTQVHPRADRSSQNVPPRFRIIHAARTVRTHAVHPPNIRVLRAQKALSSDPSALRSAAGVCRLCAKPKREGVKPSLFGIIPYLSAEIRTPSENQTMPCAIIASATLRNPAMFAPATKLPFIPYFSHASETFL